MQKFGKVTFLINLIMVCLLFSGCKTNEASTANVEANADKVRTAMLDDADVSYEIPPMYPLISVDKEGYDTKDKKLAIIVSTNLPAKFDLIDKKTGEAVYTGTVKLADVEEPDERLTGYADFSDFETEGNYYIEADIVGCSDEFAIKEGLYQEILKKAFSKLDGTRCDSTSVKCHSANVPLESDMATLINVSGGWHTRDDGQRDVVDGCSAVFDLMLAYEYYKNSYNDNMGIADSNNNTSDLLDEIIYELKWLMKMQNAQTGGVYSSVSYQKVEGYDEDILVVCGETTKATAYFCASMARFSYLCASVDRNLANECMKAANLAWKCLEANKNIVSKDQMYRAAVEMYRATGYKVYSDVINDYLKDNAGKAYENRLNLDAAITYLDTPRYTNSNYCSALMEAFMDKTEIHASAASAARYLVEPGDKTTRELLRNACELVLVDYIISSSEYGKIEKNYLHYLGGRNEQSINYINDEKDPCSLSQLILILGRLSN